MRKLISAIIASAVAISALVPVFAADTFKDVNEKSYSWAYSYVEDMAELGIVKGYEDGTFRPGNSVSRMEAFAFFARLMGSNSELNIDTVAMAKERYADVLGGYNLSYAEGDVAFMLLRGVISEDELDTYFKDGKKTEPMPRYEAAILITKAMLGEQDAKNEVLVDMDYTDVSAIPKSAKQYVYYVTQKGIMSGMGDGEFSPATDVQRGQVAVMLSKTAKTMGYAFEGVTITGIDETKKNISIKDADGNSDLIGYAAETKFFKNGEKIEASTVKSGQKAALTYISSSDGIKLAFVDIEQSVVDEKKAVIFKSYTSASGTLMVTVVEPKNDSVQSYICSSSANITIDGKASSINSIKSGDYITIGLAGDIIVEIDAMQKSTTFDAIIEKTSAMGTITISSEDAEFDGMTLSISSDVLITKNGDTASLSALGKGDSVKIKLDYGIVTRINATALTKTITGTFKGYSTLAAESTITITRDGKDYTYDVPASIEVTLNGEKAKVSDLVYGSNITIVVESDVVKKINASNAGGSISTGKITGTVVSVYETYISIATEEGSDLQLTVSTGRNTKIHVAPNLNDYSLTKIKAGDVIEAYGEYVNNSFFAASGIVVTPKAE